jgi:DNA-binding NarL/FixJ family response regulator
MSSDFAVVGQADDGTSALELWGTLSPDVCLLDVSMSGMDGIETLRRLKTIDPAARVLMLTSSEAAEDLHYALDAGASGYVTKPVRHGYTNAEIGRFLGISERTARAHVAAIMAALDAPDRAGAVAKGFDLGLLKVGSPSTPVGTRLRDA